MSDKPKKVYLTFPEQQRLHALLLSWVGTDKLEHKKMDDIVAAVNDELDIDKTISGTHIKTLKGACDDLDWEPIKGRQSRTDSLANKVERILSDQLLQGTVNKMLVDQAEEHSALIDNLITEVISIRDGLSNLEPKLAVSDFQARK